MAAFLDACRFSPAAGGTADWIYSSPVPGYQSPSVAGAVNGTLYKYRAESADLSQWELGEGAYNGGTGSFARTTVLFNSSGTTSKINFSTVPQVAIVALKEDLVSIEETNSFTDTQKVRARGNIYAAPFDAMAYNGLQINGAMDVSQEFGTTLATLTIGSNAFFIADQTRIYYIHNAGTAVLKAQQVAPPGSPSFGNAFRNCLQLQATTALSAPTSTDLATFWQPIEGYRAARLCFGGSNAQPVTIGFWVYATIAGTGAAALRNGAADRCYVVDFTINNALTWEYKTVTFPGDTGGTWLATNGVGLSVFLSFVTGSFFQGSPNVWIGANRLTTTSTTNFFATNGNIVCITGLGVWPGPEAPSAPRSPFIMRPFDQELMLCKRYWRKSYDYGTAPGTATTSSIIDAQIGNATTAPIALPVSFEPEMRGTPTITVYDNAGASGKVYRGASGKTATVFFAGTKMASIGTSDTTAATEIAFHYVADARL